MWPVPMSLKPDSHTVLALWHRTHIRLHRDKSGGDPCGPLLNILAHYAQEGQYLQEQEGSHQALRDRATGDAQGERGPGGNVEEHPA